MAALLNFLRLKTNIAAKSSTEQHAEGTEIGAKGACSVRSGTVDSTELPISGRILPLNTAFYMFEKPDDTRTQLSAVVSSIERKSRLSNIFEADESQSTGRSIPQEVGYFSDKRKERTRCPENDRAQNVSSTSGCQNGIEAKQKRVSAAPSNSGSERTFPWKRKRNPSTPASSDSGIASLSRESSLINGSINSDELSCLSVGTSNDSDIDVFANVLRWKADQSPLYRYESIEMKVSELNIREEVRDLNTTDTEQRTTANSDHSLAWNWVEVEKSFDCAICMSIANDPRLLTCGHTFCLQCLVKFAEIVDDGVLQCPLCRKEFVIPENDMASLARNSVIADMVDTLKFPDAGNLKKFDENSNCELEENKNLQISRGSSDMNHLINSIAIHAEFTATCETSGKRITGIACSEDNIYIVSEWCNVIEIFDARSYQHVSQIVVTDLKSPKDISYCCCTKALFILDALKKNNCIWKMSKLVMSSKSYRIDKWLADAEKQPTISTTPSGELLLLQCLRWTSWHLLIYSTRKKHAKLIKTIELPPEIKHPSHAIASSVNTFYICYGAGHKCEDGRWSSWTVSEISKDGINLCSLCEHLQGPLYYMTSSDHGILFTSDGALKQVLASDSQLTHFSHFWSNKRQLTPWKLIVLKSDSRLAVCYNSNVCEILIMTDYVC